jgi:hypothetical protein
LPATRLALGKVSGEGSVVAYVGNKNRVFKHQISLPGKDKVTFISTKGSKASLPVPAKCTVQQDCQNNNMHPCEVQSVSSTVTGDITVASIDAKGGIRVSCNDKATESSYSSNLESSWAGIDLEPCSSGTPSFAVSAHFCSRMIGRYDIKKGVYSSQTHCALAPTAVCLLDQCAIGIAESNVLSIWDSRSNSCCGRSTVSRDLLFGIATSGDNPNLLLTAGADRTVYTVDRRNWKIQNRWRSPLKYEAIGLMVSPSNPSNCYVAGLDNDILCGQWHRGGNKGGDGKGGGILFQNHHCGFRGDSRWIGLSVFDSKENSRGDVIVGGCESGSLYVIENAQYMQ